MIATHLEASDHHAFVDQMRRSLHTLRAAFAKKFEGVPLYMLCWLRTCQATVSEVTVQVKVRTRLPGEAFTLSCIVAYSLPHALCTAGENKSNVVVDLEDIGMKSFFKATETTGRQVIKSSNIRNTHPKRRNMSKSLDHDGVRNNV